MSQEKNDIVDSNWDRIHKTHYVTGSPNTVTSSYASPNTFPYNVTASYYNPYEPRAELINAAIEDAKQVRKNALDNAKEALEEAFANHKITHTLKQKSKDEEAFEVYTKQLGRQTAQEALDKKRKKEDPGENFKSKIMTFPKHLSYEGSVVLCVLLSMNEVAYPNMVNLPIADQTLIKSLLSTRDISLNLDTFEVRFDEQKDFILKFTPPPIYKNEEITLTMFNSVAHPRPEDLKGAGVVPVEKDGDKIEVGGKIVLNRKGIERLIGVDNKTKSEPEEETIPRRQPVAGRNAYEIRADVLQMAIDWAKVRNDVSTPEKLIQLAKYFYTFIENKR